MDKCDFLHNPTHSVTQSNYMPESVAAAVRWQQLFFTGDRWTGSRHRFRFGRGRRRRFQASWDGD